MREGTRIAAGKVDVELIRTLYEQEQLGFREVAVRIGISPWKVYRLMQEHNIARRRGSEQNYATYKTKPQFKVRVDCSHEEQQLRVAGTLLYLAEGVKGGRTVDFANSEPQLVQVFIAYLRTICGVAEARLRVLLYAYADQDIERLKHFWIETTQVPSAQFLRPYVRAVRADASGRKMPHGLVHIRYNDTRLLQLILGWGNEICESWTGAGVANRSSL